MSFSKFTWEKFSRSVCNDVDVIAVYKEQIVKFPCHKKILSEASVRFKKELSKKNNIITITKTEPHIVSLILSYIYEGKLKTTDWKTVSDVLVGAISYDITSLSAACIKSLEDSLDLSNACKLLDLASYYSIPSLYALSMNLCVNAAFHILDSEDFNSVLPSTIMAIVAEPQLQVPNETFVLYCLWIRATVDTCRSGLKLKSENIARYFESYAIYVEFEDVDEKSLEYYKNEYLMRYFRTLKPRNIRTYPAKRAMKFPLRLPLKSYIQYTAGDIVAMKSIVNVQTCVSFSMKATVYLIELRLACGLLPSISQSAIDTLSLESGNDVLVDWDRFRHNSKVGLKICERTMYSANGKLIVQEFKFNVNDLVKLHCTKTYCLKLKSSSNNLLWPEMNNASNKDCPIEFNSGSNQGLTKLNLLPCT